MSSTAPNTLGRYQIIREIARSNDIIYEAVDPTINRRIALKELNIPPDLQGAQKQERIERFWREGKAAGRLSHPNIVSIFEVGKDYDRHFIAMEFLEGQNLADTLAAAGPMSVAEASNIAIQLCDALDYAHKNGVVHRDIKPANVHILPNRHVKLTDFGIARLLGESAITRDGQVFGTPSYMSPEQISGKNVDHRSDIYSVGVLLYEMVTAQKPFQGDSIVTITYNIMNQEPPVPAGVPPYYAAIIKKAMAKDPDMRYNNAIEIMNDLKNQKCDNMSFANQSLSQPFPYNDPYSPNISQDMSSTYNTGSAPDPFGSSIPPTVTSQSQMPPSPIPYTPPKPLMSTETKNFIGIFLISMADLGFIIITALLV
ncbi:MAG: serine/threonine-protein kinase, partial [Armatimonadota bacterium]